MHLVQEVLLLVEKDKNNDYERNSWNKLEVEKIKKQIKSLEKPKLFWVFFM